MVDLSKPLERISRDLIAIDSVTGDESDISKVMYETLEYLDYCDWSQEGNSHVYSLNSGNEKTVALVGHLDTVPPAKGYEGPYMENGELWGLGAVDMKSGLACMLKLAYEMKHKKIDPKYNIKLVFYDKEEGPLPNGINNLLNAKKLDGIDMAFVLEPTSGKYAVGCLGSISMTKEVKGRAAHSAYPMQGQNAIYESLTTLRNLSFHTNENHEIDGLHYTEALNPIQINTKNAHNVIPDLCEITVNYRFSPQKSLAYARDDLRDIFGKDIIFFDESPSCYVGNKADEFLLDNDRMIMQAWTDISQLNDAGIPAINFGPGNIHLAHKLEERIDIKELNDYYQDLVRHLSS